MNGMPLLEVDSLSLEFKTRAGVVHALENVSFSVEKGETVALVGESGSGKSVLCYSMLGISDRAARITAGRVNFNGLNLLSVSERVLADIRGREISMIFQSPRTALNPIRKIGNQIEDVLKRHAAVRDVDLKARAIDCLRQVAIADPESRYHAYPFELSGGMCQRVMIALALACKPALLIADEPTTGLDVTTQASILDLVGALARDRNMGTLLITHDLKLATEYSDRILVMHAGHLVEVAPTSELWRQPRHPYTAQLLRATPAENLSIEELASIPGTLPDLRRDDLPACRFVDRCTRATHRCREPLAAIPAAARHAVACHYPLDLEAPSALSAR
jgi:peptide/nickel transport system ATP-binding protein